MKTLIKQLIPLSLLLAVISMVSCKKDANTINTHITAVKEFYAPVEGKYVKLQPATSASIVFEWGQAKAEDGSLVMYEVAFDKAGGNFSHPVYRITSDGNGVQTTLTMTHKDLNKIANMAGIQPLETGTLKWTVFSNKGINSVKADTSRTLIVERPAGFSDIPANLYLSGDATEAGTDLSKAFSLKSTAPGVFEIFTHLKPGSFFFTDRNTGTPTQYSLAGTAIKANGVNTQAADKIYQIKLDFNNAAVEMLEITKVGMYVSAKGAVTSSLTYAGNGNWSAQGVPIAFVDMGGWKDDRFKFEFDTRNAGGTIGAAFFGSTNQSNPAPPDANTAADYFKVVPVDNSQWDFTYKFPSNADGKNVNIIVNMNPSGAYKYTLTVQ